MSLGENVLIVAIVFLMILVVLWFSVHLEDHSEVLKTIKSIGILGGDLGGCPKAALMAGQAVVLPQIYQTRSSQL